MWYNGLKVDKDKAKKLIRITDKTRYAFYSHNNPRYGAYATVSLTPGKIYKVIKISHGKIYVINNNGSLKTYDVNLFYEVDSDNVFDILDTESARDAQINRLFK